MKDVYFQAEYFILQTLFSSETTHEKNNFFNFSVSVEISYFFVHL